MRETGNSNILKAQQCVELMQEIPIQNEPLTASIADNSLLGLNRLIQNFVTSTGCYNNNNNDITNTEQDEKLYTTLLNTVPFEQQLNFFNDKLYNYSALTSNCVAPKLNFLSNNYSFLSPSSSLSELSGNQSPTSSVHSITNNDINKLPLLTQNNISLLASNSNILIKQKERKRRRIVGNLDNTLDGLVAKRIESDPKEKRYRSEKEAIELPDDETEMKRMAADPDVSTRMCSICGYQGKWVSEMIRHKRVHTSERPFRCKYCNRTSKWKADLIRHVAKTHGIRVVSKYSRTKVFETNNEIENKKNFLSNNLETNLETKLHLKCKNKTKLNNNIELNTAVNNKNNCTKSKLEIISLSSDELTTINNTSTINNLQNSFLTNKIINANNNNDSSIVEINYNSTIPNFADLSSSIKSVIQTSNSLLNNNTFKNVKINNEIDKDNCIVNNTNLTTKTTPLTDKVLLSNENIDESYNLIDFNQQKNFNNYTKIIKNKCEQKKKVKTFENQSNTIPNISNILYLNQNSKNFLPKHSTSITLPFLFQQQQQQIELKREQLASLISILCPTLNIFPNLCDSTFTNNFNGINSHLTNLNFSMLQKVKKK